MLKQILGTAGEEVRYAAARTQYLISERKRQLRKVLVNGSPKTGTTWMLRMIASLPGYRTAPGHNFRGDIERYHELVPGDVAHGHDGYSAGLWEILRSQDVKVILMERDPRDQTVSRMFHVKRDTTHKWYQKVQKMSNDEILMACIEGKDNGLPGVLSSSRISQSWLNAGDKALCIKYENLLADTEGEFHRVLDYLEIKATDTLVQAILERNRFERLSAGRKFWKGGRKPGQQNAVSHYRKGIIGDWRNHFNEAHKQRFKELVGELLIELGYEQGFEW